MTKTKEKGDKKTRMNYLLENNRVKISTLRDQDQEYKFKLEQTDNLSVHIKGSNIIRLEVVKAYKPVHQPIIIYSLGKTTLSSRQLPTIQSVAEAACLPKLDFKRKFPRDGLKEPHLYRGCKDPDLYTTQGYR